MKNFLLEKAKKNEKQNKDKALRTLETLKKSVEINKELSNEPNILFLGNHSIYFERYKVCYEGLAEHWLESEENLKYYVEKCNNIQVVLISNRNEVARLELNPEDDILLDDNEFLKFETK